MSRSGWHQSCRWITRIAAVAALIALTACGGGPQISRLPTPPEPAPIPMRKPALPAGFSMAQRPGNPPAAVTAVPRVTAPIAPQYLPQPDSRPKAAASSVQQTAAVTRKPVPAPAPRPSRSAVAAQQQPLRPPAPPKAPEQASQSGESASTFAGAPTTYIVAPGENVFSIARKLNVPIRSLLEVNRLGPPFKLSTGQRLIVPVPGRHIVTRGETVYSISRRYHVDMASLMQTNRIEEPYRIAVGQVLTLPGSNNPFAAATSRARDAAVLAAQAPVAPQSTTDTPETQSAANQSKTQTVPVPRLKPGNIPKPARTGEPAPRAAPAVTVTAETAKAPAVPKAAAQQSAQAAVPKPVRRPPLGAPNPPPRSSGKFLWPLEGKILSSYGSKGSGVHNDGINIESPSGTTVRAAENGVVAYSGNELRGFGRLLLIRHSGGWVTAYAHLGQVMVSRGDTVERGQAIAKVGRTGNVSRPQLHFEIRKGTRAVDPRKLLGSKEAKL